MTNPYEQDLDRNAANHQPLTPLTYLQRAAKTYPAVHLATDFTEVLKSGWRFLQNASAAQSA